MSLMEDLSDVADGAGSEPRRVWKEYWTALRTLLTKLESKDGGLRTLLGDFPSLADIILHHADAEETDHLFNADLRQVTAACLCLFLSKMTYEAWSFTSSYNPDMIFDSIIYQVSNKPSLMSGVSACRTNPALFVALPCISTWIRRYSGLTWWCLRA